MGRNDQNYDDALVAFVQRHPAAKNWIKGIYFLLKNHLLSPVFI